MKNTTEFIQGKKKKLNQLQMLIQNWEKINPKNRDKEKYYS